MAGSVSSGRPRAGPVVETAALSAPGPDSRRASLCQLAVAARVTGREAFAHCHRGVFSQVTQSPSGPWECGLAPQLTNPICELDAGPCRLQRLEPIVLLKGSRGGANPTSRQDASDPSSIRAASDSDEAPSCEVLFYTPKCWISVGGSVLYLRLLPVPPGWPRTTASPTGQGGEGGALLPFSFCPTGFHISRFFVCQHLFSVNVN